VTENGGALSLGITRTLPEPTIPQTSDPEASPFWFAVQTKPRHEKKVDSALREKGICSFLPLHRERRRWSDRYQWVELPMFSQYLFVKLLSTAESRLNVLQTVGVLHFVGATGCGTPVPNEQIDSLNAIISHGVPFTAHKFLRVGERVRIRGGVLEGIEGILSAIRNDKSLVVSVELIQKSVAIQIDGFEIERV
jgi:transcriptional antiterminator RfaH